ncbi:hypothetical protein K504DRAFT_130130 [Pleomassaria siparia CBS 279.74]|uniref:Uncharacterized protein n=1 Tax=Pleomassaria siparia CBS 279.74 TaxID=1314801 RepID=A0A6G1KJS1_9PLEO|nr:hypothetical protein K504DRAFT_130130 [Pleomassaria siparia CBS 279.74]
MACRPSRDLLVRRLRFTCPAHSTSIQAAPDRILVSRIVLLLFWSMRLTAFITSCKLGCWLSCYAPGADIAGAEDEV